MLEKCTENGSIFLAWESVKDTEDEKILKYIYDIDLLCDVEVKAKVNSSEIRGSVRYVTDHMTFCYHRDTFGDLLGRMAQDRVYNYILELARTELKNKKEVN